MYTPAQIVALVFAECNTKCNHRLCQALLRSGRETSSFAGSNYVNRKARYLLSSRGGGTSYSGAFFCVWVV